MNRIQTLGILAFLTLTSTVFSQVIDETKIVDLTYSFDEKTIYWPTAKPFHWQKDTWKITPGGYWYAAADFAASEHGGIRSATRMPNGKLRLTIYGKTELEYETEYEGGILTLVITKLGLYYSFPLFDTCKNVHIRASV